MEGTEDPREKRVLPTPCTCIAFLPLELCSFQALRTSPSLSLRMGWDARPVLPLAHSVTSGKSCLLSQPSVLSVDL